MDQDSGGLVQKVNKLIEPFRKISYNCCPCRSTGFLFCFVDIVSKHQTKSILNRPNIILKSPKVIVTIGRNNSKRFWLNQAFPNRLKGVRFSYNRDLYNELCTGTWSNSFNNCHIDNLQLLLYDYLCSYNDSGFWYNDVRHISNKCRLCGSIDVSSSKICYSCSYNIKTKNGEVVYIINTNLDEKLKRVKYSCKQGIFIYNEKNN